MRTPTGTKEQNHQPLERSETKIQLLYIFIVSEMISKDKIKNIRPTINVGIIFIYCITKQFTISCPFLRRRALIF